MAYVLKKMAAWVAIFLLLLSALIIANKQKINNSFQLDIEGFEITSPQWTWKLNPEITIESAHWESDQSFFAADHLKITLPWTSWLTGKAKPEIIIGNLQGHLEVSANPNMTPSISTVLSTAFDRLQPAGLSKLLSAEFRPAISIESGEILVTSNQKSIVSINDISLVSKYLPIGDSIRFEVVAEIRLPESKMQQRAANSTIDLLALTGGIQFEDSHWLLKDWHLEGSLQTMDLLSAQLNPDGLLFEELTGQKISNKLSQQTNWGLNTGAIQFSPFELNAGIAEYSIASRQSGTSQISQLKLALTQVGYQGNQWNGNGFQAAYLMPRSSTLINLDAQRFSTTLHEIKLNGANLLVSNQEDDRDRFTTESITLNRQNCELELINGTWRQQRVSKMNSEQFLQKTIRLDINAEITDSITSIPFDLIQVCP